MENKLRPADEAMFDIGTRKEIQAWRARFKERKMRYLDRILAELKRRGVSMEQPGG